MKIRAKSRTAGLTAIAVIVAIAAVLVINLPITGPAANGNGFALVKPALAQQSTTFPADEAGISAYVNAGQNIDLAKARNSMRGIQAEGSNYIIGIMELPGNPEEEFPHIYVSSDGWIIAYYSKYAPVARIFQWYGYEGGAIRTTTLQDAIAKICPTIGISFNQAKDNMGYYHFGYQDATNLTVAVDTYMDKYSGEDSFSYAIPSNVTLYEASWFHHTQGFRSWGDNSYLYIDDVQMNRLWSEGDLSRSILLEDPSHLVPDRSHKVVVNLRPRSTKEILLTGVAIAFVYR